MVAESFAQNTRVTAALLNQVTLHGAGTLSRRRAMELARVTGRELDALLEAARVVAQGKGRVVGYSRKVFIPLTNLCRNHCRYCTFSKRPSDPEAHLMTPDEVLGVARAGAAHRCEEALFCLGERPEERHPSAQAALAALGYHTTNDYLRAMCELVWRETGLLPHANCGVMTDEQLSVLGEVIASGGLMLESVSERLCAPGGPHAGCPGKAPALRLAVLDAAGRHRIPFTTGVLIGIGETPQERVDALFAIKEIHDRHGHIQEVIVQNFQPHPGTPMAGHPPADRLDLLRTIALARLIFGETMNLQAPPNLASGEYASCLLAGANDWGGMSPVTRDLINPDSPWPEIEALEQATINAGFILRERLAVYPEYIRKPGFLKPRFRDAVGCIVDETGFVRRAA